MENLTAKEGKTNAIISYITIIGTIIALILNNSAKNAFVSFHVRQMVGLSILSFINSWVIASILGRFVSFGVFAFLAVLWFIGFIGALNGEEKKVPIFGDYFQDWFKSL